MPVYIQPTSRELYTARRANKGDGVLVFDHNEGREFGSLADVEALRAVPAKYRVIDNGVARVMTSQEQAAVAAAEFAQAKQRKAAEIDARSAELIAAGYPVPGTATVLSLSVEAQSTWHGLYLMRASLSYPVKLSTLDGGEYSVPNSVTLQNIYIGGVSRIKAVLDAGRALRLQVLAAADQTALDAVEDNR